MSINILPKATIRLITTSQVITSVSTAVKELMENAIDANAASIQINLINQGLDLIEVKDDGSGIHSEDIPLICQAGATSKITDVTDLDSLSSYGFRGEALNALCQVGEVSITTKTASETVASVYKFNHKGDIVSTQPSHFPKGTTISVKNLFLNLPVRKQYLSSKNRISEELKKVERVVKSLSLIHCKLRVILTHNKCVIWQKTQVSNIRLSLSQVIPLNIVSNLQDLEYVSPVLGAKVYLLLPKKTTSDISSLCVSNMQHAYFIYVNKRPVRVGKIEKMLSKEFSECFRSLIPNNKYPVCLVSIEVASDAVDVNLEPNKTKVLLREVDELVSCIKAKICDYYYDPEDIKPEVKPGMKRKKPESPIKEPVVRKAPKIIDSDETVGEGGFLNVTETTLSQLPSLLESKENDFNPNHTHNASHTLSCNYMESIDGTAGKFGDSIGNDAPLHSNGCTESPNDTFSSRIFSQDETNLPNLDTDSLNGIIPFDSHTSVEQVSRQQDSAYQSEGNALDNSFKLEIYDSSNDVNTEISRTQWSKGNVIINSKILGEPTYVPVLSDVEQDSQAEISCIERYTGKMEVESECFQKDNVLSDSTLYFQSASQDENLNQSEDNSFVPGTPQGESMENFSTFAKEIRQDMENQQGMTFGKVASQVVMKWNSLHDSGCKKKPAKPASGKSKESLGPGLNKSMLEFITKKLVRSYPKEEKLAFNLDEIKLKLLEKYERKKIPKTNLSSEESDTEEVQEHAASDEVESSDVNVDETWNHLLETSNSVISENPITPDSQTCRSNDNKFIHGILLKKYRFRIVGSHDKNWYYMCKKSLGILNVDHLYRIVTFHKHLRSYQVPCVELEDCIVLDKQFLPTVLGMDLQAVRVDSRDQSVSILKPHNDIFKLNGVGLLIRKNNTRNEYTILLTQKPKDIPAFSSNDTAELLHLASTHKPMEACRPEKVQKLIRTFTEEHCAQHPLIQNEEVITELMAYWFEHVREGKCPFLYDRKILHELHHLPQSEPL